MKRLYSLLISCLIIINANAQVPSIWHTTGIGGGGALFAPAINPTNSSEFYVGCDMSDQFHSTDYGLHYNTIDFRQLQGGHNSTLRFTNTPNLLYCISYANNLIVPVKSIDNGTTWTELAGNPDDYQETFGIWADYNDPDHVIISYYGAIYFSSNGGTSFTDIHDAISNGSGVLVGGVFFEGNNIYIGTNDGLIESTNSGGSFSTLTTTGINGNEVVASFSAAKQGNNLRFFCLTSDPGNVYVGLPGSDYWGFLSGVYEMDNNSGTWVSTMNGIDASNDFLMFVAMAENDISTAYLGGSNSSGNPNIMKTTDGGTTWNHVFNTTNNQNIATGWCGTGGDHQWGWPECLFGLAVAPSDKDKVIFTDYSDVMKTSDGGANWEQAYVDVADEHPAGSSTPTKQYYHSIGLENTACWGIYWSDAQNIFGAYTDIFGIRSKNGGSTWSFDYTAPSTNTIYRITKNNSGSTIYAATSSIHDMYKSYRLTDNVIDAGNVGAIISSTDTGATWTELHDFGHPVYWLAADPNNADRMYAAVVNHTDGLGGIWMTDNLSQGAGSTWAQLSAPPRTEGHPATMNVLNNGKLLCSFSGRRDNNGFTASSGVFVYDPSNSTWADKSDAGEDYWCRDVVVDPNDVTQNTWYCGVYSGWGGTGNGLGGLYKTTDGGDNWTRIFSGGDVSSCTFNPNNADELFVTTHGNGLWYSTDVNDASPTFTQVPSYDFSVPERVFFDPFDQNKIWVASFGHGMQWADMNETGMDKSVSENHSVLLYPNPSSDLVYIDLTDQSSSIQQSIKVYDLEGREMKTVEMNAKDERIALNISKLAAGVYFVKWQQNGHSVTAKLIKE